MKKRLSLNLPANFLQLADPLAQKGNAEVQCYLGVLYFNGFIVSQSYSEALKWFQLSAGQGNANAQYHLGVLYEAGSGGVTQNNDEALKWFRLSAEQGHELAKSKYEALIAQKEEIKLPDPIFVPDPNRVEPNPYNLPIKPEKTNRSGLLFAAGGISIAAGVAATLLTAKPYIEYGNAKRTKGKEFNLVYATVGLAAGGICIGYGVKLKKKERVQPQNLGAFNHPVPVSSYGDNPSRLDLVIAGNGAGVRLTF